MFNPVAYFRKIKNTLKLTKGKYFFGKCTSLSNVEDLLDKQKKYKDFLILQYVSDGITVSSGSGFFDRKTCVLFILRKYKLQDQADREEKLAECRLIQAKIESKLLKDSREIESLFYLNKQRMPYFELPGFFAAGTCGLYMVIGWDDPKDLCYNADDWTTDDENTNEEPTEDEEQQG